MPTSSKLISFDVDGVLIDSLPQHLQICRDEAAKFGLKLKIPDVVEFQDMVRHGAKISPMNNFFRAVGFPAEIAGLAVQDYENFFNRDYTPPLFPGTLRVLSMLKELGYKLGIITANTRENIMPALGEAATLFDPPCLHFFDKHLVGWSKAQCLMESVAALRIPQENCIYIGDQPSDVQAAETAGVRFLGVTYGWGISASDNSFPTASRVDAIPEMISRLFGEKIHAPVI